MARLARGEYIDPSLIQVIHTIQRCVRRALLCGIDPLTGKSHEHRRHWIRDRMEFLSSIFGIDCLTFTVMSNHIHIVLRSRPDVVRDWSDEQVAQRWLRLFPGRRLDNGDPAPPNEVELNVIMNDPERLAELRIRLSDVSWWMRCTSENIARMANSEDDCTGHFWEGRFKAQLLLDEASLLACSMYVDLNPIRAAIASTTEDSPFTGARERFVDLQEDYTEQSTDNLSSPNVPGEYETHDWERSQHQTRSGWLSPVEINEALDPIGPDPSVCGRRASLKGFLSISLVRYLELLDWTGRQLRSDKRGAIPSHLAPILQRMGLDLGGWCHLVSKFSRLFKRAVGGAEALASEAAQRGQYWMQAPGVGLLSAG